MSFLPSQLIQFDEPKNLKDPATHQPIVPAERLRQSKPLFQYTDKNTDTSDLEEGLPELSKMESELGVRDWHKLLFKRYYDAAERWDHDPQEQLKRFLLVLQSKLPYAVFVLIPLFAVSTSLLYWRRRRCYAEHFLFALHLHAFVFLTMLVTLGGASAAGWAGAGGPRLCAPDCW